MSKQRNKRNTRLGRAARWGEGHGLFGPAFYLKKSGYLNIEVWYGVYGWYCIDNKLACRGTLCSSKAIAKRAANYFEHLRRQQKARMKRVANKTK